MGRIIRTVLLLFLWFLPESIAVLAQTTPPKIEPRLAINGPAVKRGRMLRASLILDIPKGYHVNAHNPISKFALPTQLEVKPSGDMKVTSIAYPMGVMRRFGFTEEGLSVYENRTVIRFVLKAPSNEATGDHIVKVKLRYQSCSDQVCFPPAEREITASIKVS